MKNIISCVFVVLFISVLFSKGYCENNNDLITKSGFSWSAIKDEKVSEAKKEALDKAIGSAYYSAVLSLIPEKYIASGFEKIIGVMEADPSIAVEEFHVTGEMPLEKRYMVSLSASFNRKIIEEKLTQSGVIIEKIELPKTLLLISQKDIEDFVAYQWWKNKNNNSFSSIEKNIAIELEKLDYPVISPFMVENISDEGFGMDDVLDKKEAINIGLQKGAELVIVGRAVALPGGNKIGEKETVKVSVSLVAFKTDSGEEVFSLSRDAVVTSGGGISNTELAFEKAGKTAGEEIGLAVYSHWKELAELKEEIEIEISGENYLPRFIRFKNHLRESGVVEDLREKEITSQGSIVIAVFKGEAEELAKKMVEIPFQDFGIEITEILENKMKIKFVSNN